MSTEVKFVPMFHSNKETKGIIGTDQFNLEVEMPNEYKIWLQTESTNNSNRGLSFQSVNTNKFMDSNQRLDLKLNFQLTGHTYNTDVPALSVTPPVLWNPNNCMIDFFAVNKLIQKITFNIQNKQWSEEQRWPELFDVLASQFDLKKLKSFGIYPFDLQGQPKLTQLLGRGFTSRRTATDAGLNYNNNGLQSSLSQHTSQMTSVQKAVEMGYVTVRSTFSRAGSTVTTSYLPQFNAPEVPTVITGLVANADGACYTNGVGAELVQDVEITIHEYIISPSTSNPYAKNAYSKSYYVGSYPVNQTFDFNTDYLQTMIKMLIPTMSNDTDVLRPTLTSQVSVQPSILGFHTFDTSKKIVNPYQRTLYYNLDSQTVRNVIASTASASQLQTSRVTTANLTSLPPYIMGWVSMRIYDNPALVTALNGADPANLENVSTLATYLMQQLNNVRIQYGSQTDCMLGTQLSWREITDLTVEVIGNPELRNLILGSQYLNECPALFDYSEAGGQFADVDQSFWQTPILRNGMMFFILPTAKLNWRPILRSNVPTIPEFNYGSNNYKSLQIEIDWYQAPVLAELAESTSINFQPVVILCNKRVRSIPMNGQGPLFDERVEYDYINDNADLTANLSNYLARNNSSNDVNDELQFVGGAFIGNIASKLSKLIPIVTSVAPVLYKAYQAYKGSGQEAGRAGRPKKR